MTAPKIRITALRATTVTVPLEAPLRHANGCHWGRFVRTIVEVETDDGMIGLGEMGGGGESAEARVPGAASLPRRPRPVPARGAALQDRNPTASLYNNRTQLHAALEFACLDIMGQKLGVPVHELLGGKLRDAVPFASYLFFRYPANEARRRRGAHARAARRARAGTEGASTGSPRTSSRAACSRRTTSSSATARWPTRFPGDSAALRPERRAVARGGDPRSAGRSRICATTTSRTRSGACNGMRQRARQPCASRPRPTPSSSTSSSSPPTCATAPST